MNRSRFLKSKLTALLVSSIALGGCDSAMLQEVLDSAGTGTGGSQLSNDTIAAGLKEALTVGTGRVVDQLGSSGGFLNNPQFRIPLPQSLQTARDVAGKVGMAGYFDDLEEKMNLAAEAATPKARSMFVGAIKQLSFTDVMDIYRGADDAATQYLKGKMAEPLKGEMRPVVDSSLAQVGAVNSFNTLLKRYNALPLVDDVDANLSDHVLEYANSAIFSELANQEALIRKDPVKRTTALLKQVFGS